jgi:hypothetical protein
MGGFAPKIIKFMHMIEHVVTQSHGESQQGRILFAPTRVVWIFILFVWFVFPTSVFAQIKHVAVFETMADAPGVLAEFELRYLTNYLRKIATDELPTAGYSVLTRDNIMALLPPDKPAAECFEGQCLVDIGRNIGANYAVQGTVSRFGSQLTLTIEAYETMSGKLLKSAIMESPTVDAFLGAMREQAAPVFWAILVNDGYAVPTPLPPLVSVAPPAPRPSAPPAPLPAAPPAALPIDPQVATGQAQGSRGHHWVGLGLDVLSAAAFAFGIYQNTQVDSHYETYKDHPLPDGWKKVADAKRLRNISYGAGALLLASGLTLHFAF